MAELMKRKQVRVYLTPDMEKTLSTMAAAIESLSETDIMTTLLAAGLKACARNDYRMPLPLKFTITEDYSRLNEPTKETPYAKRK